MYTIETKYTLFKPMKVKDLVKGDIARIINGKYEGQIVLISDFDIMISLTTGDHWTNINKNTMDVVKFKSGEQVILTVQ